MSLGTCGDGAMTPGPQQHRRGEPSCLRRGAGRNRNPPSVQPPPPGPAPSSLRPASRGPCLSHVLTTDTSWVAGNPPASHKHQMCDGADVCTRGRKGRRSGMGRLPPEPSFPAATAPAASSLSLADVSRLGHTPRLSGLEPSAHRVVLTLLKKQGEILFPTQEAVFKTSSPPPPRLQLPVPPPLPTPSINP